MPMKRALSILFIFLMVSASFMALSTGVHGAEDNKIHIIHVYDAKGRELAENYSDIVANYMKVTVYSTEDTIFGFLGWQKIVDNAIPPVKITGHSGELVHIVVTWMGNIVYDGRQVLKGNISITLDTIPAVPINTWSLETLKVSPSLHEVATRTYSVKFGMGDKGNEIQISIAGSVLRDIDVNLEVSNGQTTEEHPFQFLAQSPGHVVKKEDKFLAWTTAYEFSAVKTTKVGDGMYLVVWTYGYTDVYKAWIKTVVGAALAGAILGTGAGPEGTIAGAAIGSLASGILWAIKPELMAKSENTAIGVVAGLFTPRWFIIQGTSTGIGSNSTNGWVQMSNIGGNVDEGTSNGYSYSIRTTTNEIQVAILKDVGDFKKIYMDFESGTAPGWSDYYGVLHKGDEPDGYYSLFLHGNITTYKFGEVKKGNAITFELTYTVYKQGNTGSWYGVDLYDPKTNTWYNNTQIGSLPMPYNKWATESLSFVYTPQVDGILYLVINTKDPNGYSSFYFDDITIKYTFANTYRPIFRDDATAPFIRLMFGHIPTIAPTRGMGVTIPSRDGIIAVDLPEDTGLAIDWASPLPMVIPCKLVIHSDTWKIDSLLLATDNSHGFQNVTFVAVNPRDMLYKTDFQTYTLFNPPQNWTMTVNWTPFIANHTMIYIPNYDNINWQFESMKYNLAKWWQDIGPWAHLALLGLAAFIIFIIILIVAPWLIFALIKILGLILKAVFTAIGMAAKGAGQLLGKRRRKK